jgi:hypothetical protein
MHFFRLGAYFRFSVTHLIRITDMRIIQLTWDSLAAIARNGLTSHREAKAKCLC